ncbi:MAG: hypothetical protein LIO77_09200 [Rikenellaceae bacterium]|nr:hypothetical protein [Rikenellaceae bacterium]
METMQNTPINMQDIFSADQAVLDSVIDRYPWFVSARIRRCELSGAADPKLSLLLLTRPWPAALLHKVSAGTQSSEISSGCDQTVRVIERFLAAGDKKIVPKEDTPTEDVSQESSVFIPDEDLDTGELERIYRNQGLELMDYDVAEITGEVLGIVDDE